jgi:hypothetical protein
MNKDPDQTADELPGPINNTSQDKHKAELNALVQAAELPASTRQNRKFDTRPLSVDCLVTRKSN